MRADEPSAAEGVIFTDDFEDQAFDAWTSTTDPDGDELNITSAAALVGDYDVAIEGIL